MESFKDCPLVLDILDVKDQDDYCALIICGNLLPKRRRRWCSNKCRLRYEHSLLDNHYWGHARKAALKRANYKCELCGIGKEGKLEVNHRVPLVGSGYGPSHKHHLSNLQVVCHKEHVLITKSQRAIRKSVRNWVNGF